MLQSILQRKYKYNEEVNMIKESDIDYAAIALRLKQFRKEKGITQDSIARQLGVTVAYISNVENNKNNGGINMENEKSLRTISSEEVGLRIKERTNNTLNRWRQSLAFDDGSKVFEQEKRRVEKAIRKAERKLPNWIMGKKWTPARDLFVSASVLRIAMLPTARILVIVLLTVCPAFVTSTVIGVESRKYPAGAAVSVSL